MTSEAHTAPAGRREAGLDLLRMVSMYFIVVLHLLGQGGVLHATTPFSWGFLGAWLLQAGSLCAVNCYGLISGYVGVEARFSYRKYIPRWLQVAFYSLGFAALSAVLKPGSVDAEGWLRALFPVLKVQYWYFCAYTVVFFLMPYLNQLLKGLEEKSARRLCWTLLLLFTLSGAPFFTDPFSLKFGYSPLWLIALYLVGGCLRRFGVRRLLPPWGSFGVYLLAVAGGWGAMLLYQLDFFRKNGFYPYSDPFLQYTSPFILLAALALFLCFRGMTLKNRAVLAAIRFLAPVSFGVYLIHTNQYVFHGILKDCLAPFLTLPAPAYLGLLLALALGIYLACSLIDAVRLRLFQAAGALFRLFKKRKG